MNFILKLWLFHIISVFLAATNGARILAIFPLAFKSHSYFNEAVAKSLHRAGHHITVISPFPSKEPIENYTTIDSLFNSEMYIGQVPVTGEFNHFTYTDNLDFGSMISLEYCENLMKIKEIQDLLQSLEKLYDVMLVEIFFLFKCYLPLAEKLDIPVIGTSVIRLSKLTDLAIGLPQNAATTAEILMQLPPKMNFTQRLFNLWAYLVSLYYNRIVIPHLLDAFYSQHFPEDLWRTKQLSLVFHNSHPALFSRPMNPNVIEVGGIHVQPAKTLPKNLQNFIDGAEHGVILFSLGSVINASTLPVQTRSAFVEAFSTIPQRVVWKLDHIIEGLPPNVLLSTWLPQRDILEHRNVKAFISHCGQCGMYEAIYTGTPVISMPTFYDQHSNAALLEELGVTVQLDITKTTAKEILTALNLIINDTSYYDRMQELSRRFKDSPMSPQESVVYWTEYVLRHEGAPHLRTAASDMPLYQYLLIDVGLVIVATAAIFSYIFVYIFRMLYRYACVASQKMEKGLKKD